MGGPKGNGPMDALPDELLAHAFSFLGAFTDRLAFRAACRRAHGAFQAWFYDASALARWVGPSEGMVSLHCDWCHDFTSKDTRIVFKAVPWFLFHGPVFKHCGRAQTAPGGSFGRSFGTLGRGGTA